jgi:hypothetical protein
MVMIINVADWKGTIDVSIRDVPVFVYADVAWNAANL